MLTHAGRHASRLSLHSCISTQNMVLQYRQACAHVAAAHRQCEVQGHELGQRRTLCKNAAAARGHAHGFFWDPPLLCLLCSDPGIAQLLKVPLTSQELVKIQLLAQLRALRLHPQAQGSRVVRQNGSQCGRPGACSRAGHAGGCVTPPGQIGGAWRGRSAVASDAQPAKAILLNPKAMDMWTSVYDVAGSDTWKPCTETTGPMHAHQATQLVCTQPARVHVLLCEAWPAIHTRGLAEALWSSGPRQVVGSEIFWGL